MVSVLQGKYEKKKGEGCFFIWNVFFVDCWLKVDGYVNEYG